MWSTNCIVKRLNNLSFAEIIDSRCNEQSMQNVFCNQRVKSEHNDHGNPNLFIIFNFLLAL